MRVLLVEDAPRLAQAVAEILRGEHYQVDVASTCAQAGELAALGAYDMVLLDIMLPDGSGIDVLQGMRAAGDSTPVILLTARDAVSDRVAGLDAGADDYLPKPFHASELLARMRALMRRPREMRDGDVLAAAGLVMDVRALLVGSRGCPQACSQVSAAEVSAAGAAAAGASAAGPDPASSVELTPKEAALLEALMRANGRVLAKGDLAARVWGPYATGAGNRLEVLVHALRDKIALTGAAAAIETVRGVGYRLQER